MLLYLEHVERRDGSMLDWSGTAMNEIWSIKIDNTH